MKKHSLKRKSAIQQEKSEAPLVEALGLEVNFHIGRRSLKAVRGVDLSLYPGELLAVVGESGSGKSVSVMSLLGLNGDNAESRGQIRVEGEALDSRSVQSLRELRRRLFGVIFQEPGSSFDPIYCIGKCFLETFRCAEPKISREESDRRAVKLLEEVHISNPLERLKNYPHQFSGGMLQRVMIALSLANSPKLLIADEPTTALDVTIQSGIIRLLMELKESRGLSIIFITHDLALVSGIADRIAVMYGGLILESGRAAEVLTSPASPYTAALLRSMPAPGAHYSQGPLYTIPGTVPDPLNPEPGCPFEPRCSYAKAKCKSAQPPVEPVAPGESVSRHESASSGTPAALTQPAVAIKPGTHLCRCFFPLGRDA